MILITVAIYVNITNSSIHEQRGAWSNSSSKRVIPCEIIQTGRSTIFKKNYILYTYFYIFSYFKNILKNLIRLVLPVQPFL
jgi:hypothetical protein